MAQLETVDKHKNYTRELKRKYSNIQSSSATTLVNLETSIEELWRLNPSRFLSWTRLTRILAWILRFINNRKQQNQMSQVELSIEEVLDAENYINSHKQHNQMSQVELSIKEVLDAENYIIKEMQKKEFNEEYTSLVNKKEWPKHSKLLGLCPKLDSEGIIRSDGRLTYAEFLSYDVRYPIILPRKNWVTKLIIKHYHELGNRIAGTNQILASLSTKFWIIAAREAILEWEKEYAMCQKEKLK